jgi:ribosomal protein S18 acetylase RimI-like enzyme
MLRIRRLIKGRDEPTWVGVLNAAYGEFRDWRAITVEEFLQEEQRDSGSMFSERWVAELDGSPAGVVHVFEDQAGNERRGVVDSLAIVPKFRGSGVEKELVLSAIDELEKRKVKAVLVPRLRWSGTEKKNRVEFLEELGFNLTRKTSLMEIDLARIPSDIATKEGVVARTLRENEEEDFEELNRLRNECANDRSDFQPSTVEQIWHLLKNSPYSYLKNYFGVLDGKYVGFIIVAIDEQYNLEKNVKAGIILGLGVLRKYRKAGIGTTLLLHGLEALRAKQMTKAVLDVDDLNETGALKLYEKIWFKAVEKYLTYEKPFS